jgi:hypothetical protein
MENVSLDLHGYHPDDVCGDFLAEAVKQAWEFVPPKIRP